LDGDDICTVPGDVITHVFPTAGSYPVTLCLNGGASTQKQTITVLNRPPAPTFSLVPPNPSLGSSSP
jgi:hypothetical protein